MSYPPPPLPKEKLGCSGCGCLFCLVILFFPAVFAGGILGGIAGFFLLMWLASIAMEWAIWSRAVGRKFWGWLWSA